MNTLSTARWLFNHGELPSAEAICLEIQGLQPNNDEVLTLLGDIYLKSQEADEAEKCYRRAIELNAIAPWNYVGLAAVYRLRDQTPEAIEAYIAALQINPNIAWPNVCLADLYLEAGAPKEALTYYQNALSLEKNLLLAKLGCGKVFLQQHNPGAAREYFEEILQQDKHHAGALLGLGKCAISEENWAEAIAILKQAQQLLPDNKEINNLLLDAFAHKDGTNSTAHLLQVADAAYAGGDIDMAQLHYLQLLAADPESAHPCCRLGEIALQTGDIAQALDYFTEGQRRRPEYPWSHVGLGDIHARDGRWSDAARAYQRAAELKPNNEYIASLASNAENQRQLQQKEIADTLAAADHAFANGELDLAASHYQTAIGLSSTSVHACCRLGEIALKQENAALAVTCYTQAIALQPDYVWAHFGLGQAFAALQQFEEAIKSLQTAHHLKPDMAFIVEAISKITFEKLLININKALATKSIDEAENKLKQAILTSPVNEELHTPIRTLMELRGDKLGSLAIHQIELEMQRLFLEALTAPGTASYPDTN